MDKIDKQIQKNKDDIEMFIQYLMDPDEKDEKDEIDKIKNHVNNLTDEIKKLEDKKKQMKDTRKSEPKESIESDVSKMDKKQLKQEASFLGVKRTSKMNMSQLRNSINKKRQEAKSKSEIKEEPKTETKKEEPKSETKEETSTKSDNETKKSPRNQEKVKVVKKELDKTDFSEGRKEQIKTALSKKDKTKKQMGVILEAYDDITSGDPESNPKPQPNFNPDKIGVRTDVLEAKKNIAKRELPKIQFPSTTIILAKKFSGKTNLLLNLVNKDDFDNVWIVSGTGFLGKLDKLCDDQDCLLENISEDFLDEIIKLHKETPMNSLFVFDDVIGQVDFRSKLMVKLATSGRNFGISFIISSQDFYRVPPVWRRNSEYWFLGAMTDSNILAISKELSLPSFPTRRIRDELQIISRDKKHDWLFYDDRSSTFKKVDGSQLEVFI